MWVVDPPLLSAIPGYFFGWLVYQYLHLHAVYGACSDDYGIDFGLHVLAGYTAFVGAKYNSLESIHPTVYRKSIIHCIVYMVYNGAGYQTPSNPNQSKTSKSNNPLMQPFMRQEIIPRPERRQRPPQHPIQLHR